ncbi:MAG: YdcH family protein [Pseudomonadota bacterium]
MHAILRARISILGVEHDDLDAAIDALIQANTCDDLIIARLKRRKLHIRDEIAGLAAAMSGRQQAEAAHG